MAKRAGRRKREGLLDILDETALRILKAMKEGKYTFTDLMKASGLAKSTFNDRLDRLVEFNLVCMEFEHKKPRSRKPKYLLSPLGLKILEKLEEIEQIYQEEMKKVPPKEPEEFLKKREE